MKNLLLSIMLALFPLAGFAQTYAGLWKEVAAYQQKDLPKSALQSVDKIVARRSGAATAANWSKPLW